nr:UvrD-helicase domain-containing protein [uncultured Rhodopila sp.]
MEFVAITQPTSSWLLSNTGIMKGIHSALTKADLTGLKRAEFSCGPLRMAGSADGRLLAVWNRDYLSGIGTEQWGIFKLEPPHGLLGEISISEEVLQRILYVTNQRLQALMIEGDFIHRTWQNGCHTCLAGRGNEARQYSVAYFEGGPGYANLTSKAIFVIGPGHDFDELQVAITSELRDFAPLVAEAGQIIDAQRRRPLLEVPILQDLRNSLSQESTSLVSSSYVNVSTNSRLGMPIGSYETMHWDAAGWLNSGRLSDAQKRVLNSGALRRHPIRIVGPAGSGKTLLMQLLALSYLDTARASGQPIRMLYIVHNAAMAQSVVDRLRVLGADEYLTGNSQCLIVTTLSEYGRSIVGLSETMVIDKDAQKTKIFQFEQVREALRATLDESERVIPTSSLLTQVHSNDELFDLFAILVMAEISTAIKGRGLTDDPMRYIGADTPLSRLHKILGPKERRVVFDTFRKYHEVVFEGFEMLDTDDVALSLAGRLRTPVWQLKRKTEGFDFVFVDEAQLFNENERRVFSFLTKGTTSHVPIALALDEAQEPFGFSAPGLATLGIADALDEQLPSNHRSTKEIVDLAFFVIQRTTDLFSNEFPDFTNIGVHNYGSKQLAATPPIIVPCHEDSPSFGKFLVRQVQRLRAKNVRQIAVICHAEGYWTEVTEEFKASELPLHIITQRGEKLNPDQPLVIISRPAFIGGQEFDAAILVGLERGIMPPRVSDNPALTAALEQQVLREVYLAVTRARDRVVVALNRGALPNGIIEEAKMAGLITEGQIV